MLLPTPDFTIICSFIRIFQFSSILYHIPEEKTIVRTKPTVNTQLPGGSSEKALKPMQEDSCRNRGFSQKISRIFTRTFQNFFNFQHETFIKHVKIKSSRCFCCGNFFLSAPKAHPFYAEKLFRKISTLLILYALGKFSNILLLALCLLSIIMIVIGNYLPKTRQNNIFGIRTPATLADETTWDRVHRFAGFAWTAGGIITLILNFTAGQTAALIAFAAVTAVIIVYSFIPAGKNQ